MTMGTYLTGSGHPNLYPAGLNFTRRVTHTRTRVEKYFYTHTWRVICTRRITHTQKHTRASHAIIFFYSGVLHHGADSNARRRELQVQSSRGRGREGEGTRRCVLDAEVRAAAGGAACSACMMRLAARRSRSHGGWELDSCLLDVRPRDARPRGASRDLRGPLDRTRAEAARPRPAQTEEAASRPRVCCGGRWLGLGRGVGIRDRVQRVQQYIY